ncbi:hypothetical protein [Paenibacillus prosopidis]|uniref:hypothetical protein n=1 Tax=Paenibacillus prosopidis TaxID=630520 RepID=UPI0015F1A8B9|nr:hypothetical protein [Paenibacillus prosopidis]
MNHRMLDATGSIFAVLTNFGVQSVPCFPKNEYSKNGFPSTQGGKIKVCLSLLAIGTIFLDCKGFAKQNY